eukprot:g4944.t1
MVPNAFSIISLILIIVGATIAPLVDASLLRKGIDSAVEEKIIKERLKLFKVESLIKKLKSESINAGAVGQPLGSKHTKLHHSPKHAHHHHGMPLHSSLSHEKHAKTSSPHQTSLQKNIEDHPSKAMAKPAAPSKPQGDGVPYIAGGEFETSGDGFDSALAKPTFDQMLDPLTTRL